MPADRPLRRLRFDIALEDDESIPGAIARGVRQHVLFATRPVLEAAGVDLRHAGLAQLATETELDRLAYVLRCDPDRLVARAGRRVVEPTGKSHAHATFGSLMIPRAFLELGRRRISPRSLAKHDYHRLHWLNAILPYCAESLELLVDSCGRCEATLAWRFSHGLGNCEACGEVVPPADAPSLPAEIADGYRLFAKLSSPEVTAFDAARALLADELKEVPADVLVNLALQLGNAARAATPGNVSQRALMAIPARERAELVSTGANFLRNFPHGLRELVRRADDRLAEDPSAIANLRARFRRLRGRVAHPGVAALIDSALPNVARYASHGLVTTNRYYLYTEVRRALNLSNDEMTELKASPVLNVREISGSSKRRLVQYDADQIDELAAVLRRSEPISSIRESFDLPIYAVEQFCLDGHLEVEDHPVQRIAGRENHIRSGSVADLLGRLRSARTQGEAPPDGVKLSHAANRIGGGLKPWGSIVSALLHKNVPFWMPQSDEKLGRVLVRPADLGPFRRTGVELRKLHGRLEQQLSQGDAAEVLNIAARYLVDLAEGLELRFERLGRRSAVSRAELLKVAGAVAWPGEIAMSIGTAPQSVRAIMAAEAITPRSTGWDRRQLIDAGILGY